MLKFVVFSSALARQDIILPVVREINHIKKGMKTNTYSKNSSVIPQKFSIYRSCIKSSIEVLKYN
jgi:hypothetical protein